MKYRDKGYLSAHPEAHDARMKGAIRGHPLSIRDEMRNADCQEKIPIERIFAEDVNPTGA
ncbi:MAG: hypothetical protein ACXQTD_04765 [Candidatus Syntropharchaeia archaeon]